MVGKRKKMVKKGVGLMAFLTMATNLMLAQEFSLLNEESSLTVLGTSSLHDWEITAEEQSGTIIFQNLDTALIDKCHITIVAESLKSGKSAMDRNTYKALNTKTHKSITFQLVSATETQNKGNGNFEVSALGDLTISGFKKRIPVTFSIHIMDSKIKMTGEAKLKMTDFNIEPPKALLGTITTGDEVTITFSTKFK